LANFVRKLELRHLAVLQAISKSGSFWGAAERLDLTPSTVSQQMSSLEAVTGVRLVERQRGRRRVELTPAGNLLLRHADAILARVKAAESDFSAFRAGTKGVLRVGTYPSIGARILPSVLPKFASEWPGIEVQLVEGLPDQLLLTMVASGELDVTFTTLPTRPGPFESIQLLEDPYVVMVAREVQFGRGLVSVSAGDLAGLKLLGISTCREEVEDRLRMLGLEPQIWFPSTDNAVVQGLASAGVGAAIVPAMTVQMDDDRIRLLQLEGIPPRTLALTWHADRYHPPAVQAFATTAARFCETMSFDIERMLGTRH